MSLIWNDKLLIGHLEIDNQHKELYKKVNDLLNAMKHGKGKEEVQSTIKFLEKYTITHFGTEEKLMLKIKYPDYQDHKAQHDGLINDLEIMKNKIEKQGSSSFLAIEIQKQLSDWLTYHIGMIDKMLGDYIKNK